MSVFRLFLWLLFLTKTIIAKSFSPCELRNELLNVHNLTADESQNLTCIAQKFSGLNTNIIVGDYYGLFQIKKRYCGENEAGGKCKMKCEQLLDDDITDDVECAKKQLSKLTKRLKKSSGCHKEFKYLDENCHRENQVQQDFCESAFKLVALYDISKIDALTWSCIAEFSKTGNVNNPQIEDVCVKTRDIECAIKNHKQTGFTNWPAYDRYCKNISESLCLEIDARMNADKLNIKEKVGDIKNFSNIETSMSKMFTTSTQISLIIEDEEGNTAQYSGADVTTESIRESQRTTEFLSKTLEKPSDDENRSTIEGYSRVRIMYANKNDEESLDTPHKSDDNTLISSSSTTESMNMELAHVEHTTDEIVLRYFEEIDKCSLARDMSDSGRIPENLISTFVCIAEHESGMNLSFINTDGQQSRYGLFQIDNQIYCSTNSKINQCDVLCAHLVDDQFDNDFECVRHIYKKEGLNYWPSYEKSCKNVNANSLDSCYKNKFTTSHRPFTVISKQPESSKIPTDEPQSADMTTMAYDTDSESNDAIFNVFCDLSYQLIINGTILDNLHYYMCIVDKSTELRLNSTNGNDERFGTFGLKSNTCGINEPSGLCNLLCTDLLDDDLNDDLKCATKIYESQGLTEWNINKDDCFIYKAGILRCINEDKFSLPSDEDEISQPADNMKNLERKIETEVETVTKYVDIDIFGDTEKPTTISTDLNESEVISEDGLLMDVTTNIPDINYEGPVEENLIELRTEMAGNEETTEMKVESDEFTTTPSLAVNVDLSESKNEAMKQDLLIEMLIKSVVEEELKKLATSTEMAEGNIDNSTYEKEESFKNQSDTFLMKEEKNENSDEEVTTTFSSISSSQSILLRIPAIRYMPSQIKIESISPEPEEIADSSTDILEDLKVPQTLALISDIRPDETTHGNLPKITTSAIIEENIHKDSTNLRSKGYFGSIQEIIDEYDKHEINTTVKLTKRNGGDFRDQNPSLIDEIIITSAKVNLTTLETSTVGTLNDFYMDICALAQYMNTSGFDHAIIPTFVCIAERESNFNIQSVLSYGTYKKFGLFQIDDEIYCNTNNRINECNVSCGHLVDSNFEDDLECVLYIYENEGFNYWPSYQEFCRNINPHSLDYCYQEFSTSHRPFTVPRWTRIPTVKEIYSTAAPQTEVPIESVSSVEVPNKNDDSHFIVKSFEMCELARIIYTFNRSVDDIPVYLGVADIKSQLKIKKPRPNDESYGLFNIHAQFCGQNQPSGICSMKCSQLWDENILDDVECLEKIYETNNFGIYNLYVTNFTVYNRKLIQCYERDQFYTTKRPKRVSAIEDVQSVELYDHKNMQDEEVNDFDLNQNFDLKNEKDEDEMTTSIPDIPEQITSAIRESFAERTTEILNTRQLEKIWEIQIHDLKLNQSSESTVTQSSSSETTTVVSPKENFLESFTKKLTDIRNLQNNFKTEKGENITVSTIEPQIFSSQTTIEMENLKDEETETSTESFIKIPASFIEVPELLQILLPPVYNENFESSIEESTEKYFETTLTELPETTTSEYQNDSSTEPLIVAFSETTTSNHNETLYTDYPESTTTEHPSENITTEYPETTTEKELEVTFLKYSETTTPELRADSYTEYPETSSSKHKEYSPIESTETTTESYLDTTLTELLENKTYEHQQFSSTEDLKAIDTEKSTKSPLLIQQNVHDLSVHDGTSQIGELIRKITGANNLGRNGSIIFNIFNFNINPDRPTIKSDDALDIRLINDEN